MARRLRAVRTLSAKLNATSWREWPAPLRDRDPRALDDARRQLARDVLGSSTCSGSPRRSGSRRERPRATPASPSSATCRSSSEPTAPTSGCARTSSCSTSRSACRRTRSAPPGQDWGLPDVPVGRRLRRRTMPGCASARAAWPRSTTAIASIISSACTARTASRRRASRSSSPAHEPAQLRRAKRFFGCARERRHHHRRGSRGDAGLRARVTRAARRARVQGAALGARLARARTAVHRSGRVSGASRRR